jgi:hypothetical protein
MYHSNPTPGKVFLASAQTQQVGKAAARIQKRMITWIGQKEKGRMKLPI